MCTKRQQLETVLVLWCFIQGALPLLTKTPENVLIEKGDDVSFECSSDAPTGQNTIQWLHDGSQATRLTCEAIHPTRYSVSGANPLYDCDLTGLANDVSGNHGPYGCNDGSGIIAEAVAILIDPKSWCAVIGAPIRGEDATLSCAITYHNLGDARRLNPGAEMTAVVSWEAAAGTPGSPSTTATDSGATVQVNVVTTQTTGTEIPSFKCTLDIQFENRSSVDYIYALNSLSWDCVSAATLTWYCPTTVTVTESTGPYNAGDMLRCSSDGYPEPSYSWTDADGNVVSTASTVTLFGGPFDYQCTVTGNFTTPCSASSARVSGNAAGSYVLPTTTVNGSFVNETETITSAAAGDDMGLIIGIVVGLLLLALLLAALGFWLWWRRRKKEPKEEDEDDGRPKLTSVAFYQGVSAAPPKKMNRWSREKKDKNARACAGSMDRWSPRCIDNHAYDWYSNPARFFSPQYKQQCVSPC